MVTAQLRAARPVANTDSPNRSDVPKTSDLVVYRRRRQKTTELTTLTHRKMCRAGSAPILLQWHRGRSRLTTASLRQIVEMNFAVSLTLNPLPK
jgi:hypothetical protein